MIGNVKAVAKPIMGHITQKVNYIKQFKPESKKILDNNNNYKRVSEWGVIWSAKICLPKFNFCLSDWIAKLYMHM